MRRALFAFFLLLAAFPSAALAANPPPSAASRIAKCGVGARSPSCYFWDGKVTFIGDGDTMSVDIAGDGSKRALRVRITGIQAMEEYVHTSTPKDRKGECHANEATARLEHLVKASRKRVRLSAQDPASTSRGRYRRAVAVKINHRWRDVGRIMLNEGNAIWLPSGAEWAWNASYSVVAERAASRFVGIWNPEYCQPGPFANVKMWVQSDADGADGDNVNGEFVRIKNLDPVNALPLGGWWLRDSDLRRYTFAPDEAVPPNSTVTVYVGDGYDAPPGELYWNLTRPVFDNASSTGKGGGDGAYLFDADGDLRAHMQYPCRLNCSDPLKGAVKITSAYKRHNEYVTLRNVSSAPVDLEGYRLWSPGYTYAFQPPSVIQPGEEMRVYTQGVPDEDQPLVKYWGNDGPMLNNRGDKVKLSTFDYIDVGCDSWGSASCS
jgi:endonuclease YncB( thermonuclease family)